MPDLLELLERSAAGYTPPPDLRARVSERRRLRQRNRRAATGSAAVLVIAGIVAVLPPLQNPSAPIVSNHPPEVGVPDLTTTFVSPRNGFSVRYPDGASVTPAVQLWEFDGEVGGGFDVVETGSGAVFEGASIRLPIDGPCLSGTSEPIPCGSIDEQVDRDFALDLPAGCGVPRGEQAEITIDGQPGRVAECRNRIEATVVVGGRLYLFVLSHDRSDARAVFDAFVATIELRPETAVDLPGLTTTFVSPTYGYSFGYIDRGGLSPATQLWDPSNQPREDINLDDRFDAVETGLGAAFEGASTPIPAGVSIDEWVDEYVTAAAAGGCGVPRSQQAEITIDGQSARIAECLYRVEATAVAGERLYVFILSHSGGDARTMFDAWVDTIELTPETAATS